PLTAQHTPDRTPLSASIPYERTDDTQWFRRFQDDIDAYAKENAQLTDRCCDVLFLGSSSIHLWHNIYNDLAPLKIIRRSYGGSTLRDQIYNYDVVARGYRPRQIALYIENDLGNWPGAVGPGECYDLFRILIGMLRQDYPGVPIRILSFKPAFAKMDQLHDQKIVNQLLREYADRTEGVTFIYITPPPDVQR
ncbi:MAG: lipase, partial [Bacteroides sp.]|nr:lipase [Bacteroides sp.]